MGWHCTTEGCDWRTDSDALTGVVRHEIMNEGHEVEPELDTALTWSRAGLA